MANNNFKVGDVVQSKAGGPVMTVMEMLSDGSVNCRFWSDAKGEYLVVNFGAAELTPASTPGAGKAGNITVR